MPKSNSAKQTKAHQFWSYHIGRRTKLGIRYEIRHAWDSANNITGIFSGSVDALRGQLSKTVARLNAESVGDASKPGANLKGGPKGRRKPKPDGSFSRNINRAYN
jgi:hypothetical protein